MKTYQVIDAPTNGTSGQFVGEFTLETLPERLREAVDHDPDAGEWVLPALSGGDEGEPLDDLEVIVRTIVSACDCTQPYSSHVEPAAGQVGGVDAYGQPLEGARRVMRCEHGREMRWDAAAHTWRVEAGAGAASPREI